MMDEPDYPMLDVGDFEVLDECVGEDDDEVISYDGDEEDHINEAVNDKRGNENAGHKEDFSHIDENSGDNTDNILDVSIDIEENEFLESVANDFSENIEEDVEERPRITRSSIRREPTVQLRKLDMSTAKIKVVPEITEAPRKKPGPKSKTMNIQAPPTKRPIQKITFNSSEKENITKNQKNCNIETSKSSVKPSQKNDTAPPQKNSSAPAQKNSNAPLQKNISASPQKKAEPNKTNLPAVPQKKSVFLKADLTDEEIMMHFDEIENTVLTSDTFVIQEEVDQAAKEENRLEDENSQIDKNMENEEEKKTNNVEEENWDNDSPPPKKKNQIKIEQEEFKESEMWYKEKLKKKQEAVEIKFSKLAGMINYSYPCYKRWLDRNDVLYGTAICKVEPSKHIPLDQLQHNRWKFVCNKKQNQQSTKEKENEDNASSSENNQWGWNVIPGVPDAKLEDTEEYPSFITRSVKLFGEFLNLLEAENNEITNEDSKDETAKPEENDQSETSKKIQDSENEKKKISIPPDGFVILLRCNRKEELMMNITGKNISQEFKDRLREHFQNGPGSEANVKSFYCKSIIKENNVISTESVLLFGKETLDDTIGSIKINLPPKANMWANLSGVEVLANTITEFLLPTPKTTVVEIGCGSGVMSLLLASKCLKVIGVDIEKEVSEAQSLCNLNEIKNALFLTGNPEIFMKDIEKSLEDSKTVAVVNMNSVFGRSIKVIKGLRKITTLGRIVIITTLTKQAIRSLLELVQPANTTYGNPFIPIRACLVDTTPKHFGFDIVMSMERRTMRNLLKVSPVENVTNPVGLISKSKQEALKKNSEIVQVPPFKKGAPTKFTRGGYTGVPGKFFPNPQFKVVDKFGVKRPFAEDDTETFQPGFKKFKSFEKPWQGSNIRPNPMHDKKLRSVDEEDLRARLSNSRVEPSVIVNEITEQKKLLDAAKEKLTGASSSVDNETVKKLQEMLNLAIEKTNKLQSQLPPRSVWDRIAPAEGSKDEAKARSNVRSPPMKGRLVKETGSKEITITTSNNREYSSRVPAPVGKSKKYSNVPPAEPNLIQPIPGSNKSQNLKPSHSASQKPNSVPYHKPGPNRFTESSYRKPSETWDKGKPQAPAYILKEPSSRYVKPNPPQRPLSPPRQSIRPAARQASPPRRPITPPRRQPLLSPPRRPLSPPRRPASPIRRPASPPRRPVSPGYRQHSSSSRNVPTNNRQSSPPRRFSPPRRPFSPPANRNSPPRQKSPPRRYADEWDIPSRGAVTDSGWRPEKEKSSWHAPPPVSSNWDQTSSSNNNNRYRPEGTNWDNPSPTGPWKGAQNNSGSNWDVKKDPPREMGRHEPRNEPRIEPRHESRFEPRHEPPRRPLSPPRHEPRHEPPRLEQRHEPPRRLMSPPRHESRHEPTRRPLSPPRHEPRHEPSRRPLSPPRHESRHEPRHESRPEPRHEPRWEPPEKDDYDLPEDARDPWGDDHPTTPKEVRWVPPTQSSQQNVWGRDKPNEPNWSTKPSYSLNNMGGTGPNIVTNIPNSNPNLSMGLNLGMNNPKQPVWQPPAQQQQNRNTNWLPPGNWQGGSGNPQTNMPPAQPMNMMGNVMNNWQQPQQTFSSFPARPYNNNPFMNNRR